MSTLQKQLSYNISSVPVTKSLTYFVAEDPQTKLERETTTVKKRLYLDVLEKTMGTTSAICHHIDITRGTFYNWINNDPEFKASVYRIKDETLNDIEETLVKLALKENFQAAKFILLKRHPDYKKQTKESKESIVHIYHHTYPKKDANDKTITAEDDINQFFREEKIEDSYTNSLIEKSVRKNG